MCDVIYPSAFCGREEADYNDLYLDQEKLEDIRTEVYANPELLADAIGVNSMPENYEDLIGDSGAFLQDYADIAKELTYGEMVAHLEKELRHCSPLVKALCRFASDIAYYASRSLENHANEIHAGDI